MSWLKTCLVTLLHVAAATNAPQGARLLQAAAGGTHRRRNTGMPPCKRCGGGGLHSRDELLATDDGELLKMKDDLTNEVEGLEKELDDLKKDNGEELGKLDKRLSDLNAAYKKFGEDAIARTSKFADAKAKASKDLSGSLDGTEKAQEEISTLNANMNKLRTFLNPYVDKFISGKGWPHGCKCAKAKALLQRLQASLSMAKIDLSGASAEETAAPARRGEALLRRSAKTLKPADQEKYKLVRAVQQLEEKRAKMMQEKSEEITGFGQQQRITLERIDTAQAKARLKATTEQKYKDSDASLEKVLKSQNDAAGTYLDSAKAQLARLKKNEAASLELFKSFKAELTKCKCL